MTWSSWIITLTTFVFTAFLGLVSSRQGLSETGLKNITNILNRLLDNYDKRIRPGFGGNATVVNVSMNIRSMGPVSERNMMYSMDCYFRQMWTDTRLKFEGPLPKLQLNVKMLEKIWKPDTYILNGKGSYLHRITGPNILLRLTRDGDILYSMRLTIKATCPMHLEKFPMDMQNCPFQIGSYGYSTRDVSYRWVFGPEESIKISPDMKLSQFDLIGHPAGNETFTLKSGTFQATYSSLHITFTLQRHMGFFLIQVYFPCSLLVVLSWVAFWINREATADRIALGVMTVLTMAFLGIDNRTSLPKVSYSTALDWYLATCFAFVLATIIQFAGVHYFTKHGSGELHLMLLDPEDEEEDEPISYYNQYHTRDGETSGNGQKLNGDAPVAIAYDTTDYNFNENCFTRFFNCLTGSAKYRDMKMRNSKKGVNSVSKIDKLARLMFPLAFFLFNLFYWVLYLKIL
ncbi:gamma-aminobutyric acid receptor subunit alpha-2-like [Tubulanus polymorphus]|uniref:gamma-aminobutyric acid receptor subunit alpha-2-like n=1 Tax=Tubulanus polymorphus TaxID=672921 RepID=UPI003DA59E95